MSTSLFVSPEEMLQSGSIHFDDIAVNAYQPSVADEVGRYSKQDLINIYRDMCYIREFETMFDTVKNTGEYHGVQHIHTGPAHLGIGQEASYVGQAYHLTPEDCTFGSHRSHGEILARGLRTIETMDPARLVEIMENYLGGRAYAVVRDTSKSVQEVARDFFLYGMICETFASINGFNLGLGGSMHAFFLPFGIYPNNAIVGGSGAIAPGAALYKLVNKKPGVVVCNLGDGSLACGPVWEGFMMSTMEQTRRLWGEDGGAIPILYHVIGNSYAMGGQPGGETMGFGGFSARVAAAFSHSQLHVERINGYNPLSVIDAYGRKLPVAKADGPVLLDVVTYRLTGHSTTDPGRSYRTHEELDAWRKMDSIPAYARELIEAGLCTQADLDAIAKTVREDVLRNLKRAADPKLSPVLDALKADASLIPDLMFSNEHVETLDTKAVSKTLLPYAECPRVKQIAGKKRFALEPNGTPIPTSKVFQMRDAIIEPILQKFYEDPTFIAFGEDLRDWGGSFGVFRGVTEALPYYRFFNTPISEAGFIGSAVGYGMMGGRCLAEFMFCDFMGRAGDELFNQLAKWQSMSAGLLRMPVVIRLAVGGKFGAQHSQDWSALPTHIPGLKVIFPATPFDAKGLLQSALNGTDPVIVFESQRLYDMGELFHAGGVPTEAYEIPLGLPDVKRVGNDITILTIGSALYRAIEAADQLQSKYGISAEIIDARSLVPFDYSVVAESVQKTGRIVIVGDACERTSFMRNLASNIAEICFNDLDAPPVVVGARDWIIPSYEQEQAYFPQAASILDAIHARILPLPGHITTRNFTVLEQMRRAKAGV